MTQKEPKMVDIEVEIDDEDLEYLKKNNIDLNELCNKFIEKLRLEESIKRDSERLAQIKEEIRELGKP